MIKYLDILLDITRSLILLITILKGVSLGPKQRFGGSKRGVDVILGPGWHFLADLALPRGPVLGDFLGRRHMRLMKRVVQAEG